MRSVRQGFAVLVLAGGVHGLAMADCSVSSANASLGSVSSLTLDTTGVPSTEVSTGLACGGFITVAVQNTYGVQIENNRLELKSADGGIIPFDILRGNGQTVPLNAIENMGNWQFLDFLGLFGARRGFPMRIGVPQLSGVVPGTYTATINTRWYYHVCEAGLVACLYYSGSPGIGNQGFLGMGGWGWGTGVLAPVTLTLVVTADCQITTRPISFGAEPSVEQFTTQSGAIGVKCSAGTPYTVGINNGNNAVGDQRNMRGGASLLAYEIYKPGTSNERWGTGSAGRSSLSAEINPGIHDGVTAQEYQFRAEIMKNQATPPPGDYSDVLQVLIEL